MSLFSWQCQNLCLLSLAYITDCRVVFYYKLLSPQYIFGLMDELKHWQDLLRLTAARISPFLLAVFPGVSCEGTHVGNNVLHRRPIDIPHLERGILCKKTCTNGMVCHRLSSILFLGNFPSNFPNNLCTAIFN